jgi:hypothetical protein
MNIMKFNRSIFPADSVEKYFETYLCQIEKLYHDFSKMPERQTIYFLSEKEFKKLLKNPQKIKEATAYIVYEVYNRFQFLFFTNLFKLLKYIESLIYSWNSQNYLGWVLFGRAVIELCAVFNYFDQKLNKYDLLRTDFTHEEISNIENILIQYSHGTRFDWNALIEGDFEKLKQEFEAKGEFRQATNVLTTIDKLKKLGPAFHDVRTVYDILSDYAHPNMGSHSIFIDLPHKIQDPMPNHLSLNVNQQRGEFIIVTSLVQITICLTYCGHLLQELAKVLKVWGGYSEDKTFSIRFKDTIAVLKKK